MKAVLFDNDKTNYMENILTEFLKSIYPEKLEEGSLSEVKKNELNNFEFPTVDLLCDYDTEKSENEWIV